MRTLFYLFTFLTFILSSSVFSQNRAPIIGKIIIDAENESPEGINIINLQTSQNAQTDIKGQFNLSIQTGDIILISSDSFEDRRYTITKKNIQETLEIHLNIETNTIEEVVVSQLKFLYLP